MLKDICEEIMKKKILLLGVSLESDNRGVNALGIGALTLLKKTFDFDECNILHFSNEKVSEHNLIINNSNVNVKIHYFPAKSYYNSIYELIIYRLFKIFPQSNVAKIILDSDIAYDVNEGDSFSDIYGSKRIIRHFLDSFLVILAGKPLIFLPQTIGPFKTFSGKVLGSFILKNLKKLYIRDSKSVAFLKSLGVSYQQSIDMATFMEPKAIDISVKPTTIGLNINGLMYLQNYKALNNQFSEYKYFIETLIQRLLELNHSILLIPHTYNIDNPNPEDDFIAIKEISKNINNANLNILSGTYDAQELKYIISKTDFFIGSRMHSCIAALSTSVPCIGLAYSYKFEGTFKMFNQKDCVISLNKITKSDTDNIINQILKIIENMKIIKSQLQKENNEREELIIGI